MRLHSTGALVALALSSLSAAPLVAQTRASAPPAQHLEILDHGTPAYTASAIRLELRGGAAADDSSALAYVPVVWESSDPMRAWISQNGTVVFVHTGKVTITARSGEATASKIYDVQGNPAAHVALAAPAHVRVGQPARLSAAVLDRQGRAVAGARVNYGVMQSGAAVDDHGTFIAQEPGTYTVLAEANGTADTREIVVDGPMAMQQGAAMAQRIDLPAPRFTVYVGTSVPLAADVRSADARDAGQDAPVQWSVDRASIATVSPDGVLRALAPGEVTVTARSGSVSARRSITIVPNMTARVTLSAYSQRVTPGDTVRVNVEAIAPGARAVRDARVAYGVAEPGSLDGVHATISSDGRFVASRPGVYTIFAAIGDRADQETILVQ